MLNLNIPLNNLSFGFVGYQILKELYKRNKTVNLFPIGGGVDLSCFDKTEESFQKWIGASINSLQNYDKNSPTLKLWHINQGWESVGRNQVLFTFHETDQISNVEANILNQQKAVIVSSEETKKVFEDGGVTVPVYYVPLGFDKDYFNKTQKKYYPDNVTCWTIAGKAEMRKATAETINVWLKKYGNSNEHILHLMIYNPFYKPEDNSNIIQQICQGKQYTNINPLPYMKTLTELNECYNATDITVDMSLGEGWSLPSFHMLGLGKHAVVHNCSAMKGWANQSNSVLVEPKGKVRAFDGIFFRQDTPFNIGNFYKWEEQDLSAAFDLALARKKASKINMAGLKIQDEFTWKKTTDVILDILEE
jgi:hypothetical protein